MFRKILLFVFSISLPIWLLIRASVFAFAELAYTTWPSLALGAAVSISAWMVLGFMIRKIMNKAPLLPQLVRYLLGFGFIGYALFGLVYVSSLNTKSEDLQSEYLQLHPILRLAVVTTTLFDPDLVMTDLSRSPADYASMGLSPLQYSLHYTQKSGFTHAVDLRTKGRPELLNNVLQGFFRASGFSVKRHVGTDDHLHISLPPRGEGAKPTLTMWRNLISLF